MKRITNRTLSPIINETEENKLPHIPSIKLTKTTQLERSTSSKNHRGKAKVASFGMTSMIRRKSAGSNSNDSHNSSHNDLNEEQKINIDSDIVPKIYVQNKLNRTKTLHVWNNNIVNVEEELNMNDDLDGINGLDGMDDITKNLSFPDQNADAALSSSNLNKTSFEDADDDDDKFNITKQQSCDSPEFYMTAAGTVQSKTTNINIKDVYS